MNKVFEELGSDWELTDDEDERGDGAARALSRLRPQADRCLPELSRLMTNDASGFYSAKHAIEALTGFGEAALPILLDGITNGSIGSISIGLRRLFIMRNIASLGTNAHAAVPTLQAFLTNDDRRTRMVATNALRMIDPQAWGKGKVQ